MTTGKGTLLAVFEKVKAQNMALRLVPSLQAVEEIFEVREPVFNLIS